MLKELIKIANKLDQRGLVKEADYLDELIKRSSLAGIICLLTGCSPAEDLKGGIVDWKLIKDENGNVIDVDAICNGVADSSCVDKEYVPAEYDNSISTDSNGLQNSDTIGYGDKIILTWKCAKYKNVVQDIALTWQAATGGQELDSEGNPKYYFVSDPMGQASSTSDC